MACCDEVGERIWRTLRGKGLQDGQLHLHPVRQNGLEVDRHPVILLEAFGLVGQPCEVGGQLHKGAVGLHPADPAGDGPVSYTHLVEIWADGGYVRTTIATGGTVQYRLVGEGKLRLWYAGDQTWQETEAAVSYTHLDVYKRQVRHQAHTYQADQWKSK